MRKMILFAVLAALAAMMLVASPAMASHNDDGWRDDCDWDWVRGVGWVLDCDDDDDFNRFDVFEDIDGVSFETGDVENESGDVEIDNDFSIEGDNSNACIGQSQFGQTGNFTNQQGVFVAGDGVFVDDDDNHNDWWNHNHNWWNHSNNWWNHDNDRRDHDNDRIFFGDAQVDDIEFEGPEVTFAPENETTCDQSVEQAAAASTWGV